ncbi:hypothetical protein B0H11DRAFT_2021759 [Mycena galericulata]|nr:hypothetical protein B0H11DRAFT_2021759 [Mycena galericulata]
MKSHSSAQSNSKRPRADSRAEKENREAMQATKKARLEAVAPTANPYAVLPPPTSSFIQLRFQLARFKGVCRVARVPLNYTFAHLYKLILFMFGWNGQHMHRANVYSHVEMYSGNYKAGHIKKYGKHAPLPDTDDEQMIQYYELTRRTDIAEYEVVMKGESTRVRGYNSFGDFSDNAEVRVEDQDICLSQVWNEKLRRNASKGACSNKEIGVIYEYDLGASWEIHLTMDREDDFFSVQAPSNMPIMVNGKNKGAPPIEDAQGDVFGEIEARHKTVEGMFYDANVFERYLKGEVSSYADKTSLKVRVRDISRETVRAATKPDGDGDEGMGSSSDDDDTQTSQAERMTTQVPRSSRAVVQASAPAPESRLALVPSTSRAVVQTPGPVAYDDLQDAEGESDSEFEDEDEIDEEALGVVAAAVVMQQMGAVLLMLMLLRRQGRI